MKQTKKYFAKIIWQYQKHMYICVTKQKKQKTMYTVTTTHQPSRTVNQQEFIDYHEALNYFNLDQDEKINGTKAEWDGIGKPNLNVGGRGHDYLIELTEVCE